MRSMKKSYTEYNLMMVRRTVTMATMMLNVMMMTMMVILMVKVMVKVMMMRTRSSFETPFNALIGRLTLLWPPMMEPLVPRHHQHQRH